MVFEVERPYSNPQSLLLAPIVGIGIILWDVWDYNRTVAIDRPVLHANIADYLQEMNREHPIFVKRLYAAIPNSPFPIPRKRQLFGSL